MADSSRNFFLRFPEATICLLVYFCVAGVFLARVEVDGELSAICFDGEVSHAVQKIPVAGDYRVQDDHGASDHPVTLTTEQAALFDRVLITAHRVAPGLEGQSLLYARIDLMWDDHGALCLTELELVEPSLFFRHGPRAPARLVDALVRRVSREGGCAA